MSRKNLVKINYMGIAMEVDAEKDWDRLTQLDIEERRRSVLGDLHFMIHIFDFNLSHEIKTRFLDCFSAAGKARARDVALEGVVNVNHQGELLLLQEARQYHRERGAGKIKNADDFMESAAGFAVKFAEIADTKNVPALRRMIAIMESSGIPDGSRGGIGSEERFMLEKFCDLHISTRSLPTKSALRKACRLNGLEDKKLADNRMKKLGLWGLPTEPEI